MQEKPVHDFLINTGVYVIEPRVLSYIPKGQPMDMNELINVVIRHDAVSVFQIYGGWVDIGQWGEYHKSLEQLMGQK